MKRERFACTTCPAFFRCSKPDLSATADGWEKISLDGKEMIFCRPGRTLVGKRVMKQYSFYCLATRHGKMIAGMADYTGNVPLWCPRLEGSNENDSRRGG